MLWHHQVIPVALLAALTTAKPVALTASSTTQAAATPSCSAIYTPRKGQDCGNVAAAHYLHLHDHEADFPSISKKCEELLRGYGICFDDETTTDRSNTEHITTRTDLPCTTPSILSPNTTFLNNTVSNMTIVTKHSDILVTQSVGTRERIVTRWETSTLSYTLGIAPATTLRTIVITRTVTETVTFTTTVTVDLQTSTGLGSMTTSSSSPSATTSQSSSTSEFSQSSLTITSSSLPSASTPATKRTSTASCSGVSPPPAAVTEGVVAGCTQWYTAIPGDYCYKIAVEFGILVTSFMDWNPTINRPYCTNLYAGSAYCISTCDSLGGSTSPSLTTPIPGWSSVASTTTNLDVTSSTTGGSTQDTGVWSSTLPTPTAPAFGDVYTSYLGDGSVAAGWPSIGQWIDFDDMFAANRPNMKASCAQWGVPDDSDEEIANMKSAIQSIGAQSGIDERFILAIIMQESTGCVRVITTAYSHPNPGLMQSHNGTGTCNTNGAPLNVPGVPIGGVVQTPCPASEITQMVKDGTEGTAQGDGLVQIFAKQGISAAQGYYRTARIYNGGSIAPSGLLQDGCCTASYSSDVANRLTGWVNAPRMFNG